VGAEVDVYDTATNAWATAAPLPTPACGPAGALTEDGRIVIVGGGGVGCANSGWIGNTQIYAPTTNTWTAGAPLPTPRGYLELVAAGDGKLYAIGGDDTFAAGLSTVEIYNPTTNTWATGPSLTNARYGFAASLGGDGRIYAISGTQNNGSGVALASVEALTPGAAAWVAVAPIPSPVYWITGTTASNGNIYVMGGFVAGTTVATVQVYDPVMNSWATSTSMPAAYYLGAATTGPEPDSLLYYSYGTSLYAFSQATNTW